MNECINILYYYNNNSNSSIRELHYMYRYTRTGLGSEINMKTMAFVIESNFESSKTNERPPPTLYTLSLLLSLFITHTRSIISLSFFIYLTFLYTYRYFFLKLLWLWIMREREKWRGMLTKKFFTFQLSCTFIFGIRIKTKIQFIIFN